MRSKIRLNKRYIGISPFAAGRIIRPGKQRKNVLNSLPRPAEKLRRR